MLKINYNHLYYFQVIAKTGSIKAATKVLHVAQPTLSNQLRQFEESLGQKLFDRQNRGLVLNDAGLTVLKYANEIFSLGNEMLRLVKEGGKIIKETINIGIVPSLSRAFTYEFLLPVFDAPNFKVRVREGDLNHLLEDLALRNIDVILSDYFHPDTSGLEVEKVKIGVSRYFAVSGRKLAKARRRFPASLHGQPLFHYTLESPIRREIDRFFERNGVAPRVVAEADDLNFVRVGALNNRGFSVLPESAIREMVAENKLYIVGELEELKAPIWAVHNVKNVKTSVGDMIRTIAQERKRSRSRIRSS